MEREERRRQKEEERVTREAENLAQKEQEDSDAVEGEPHADNDKQEEEV